MMRNLVILLFSAGILCSFSLKAQHIVYMQNNTALDYDFQVVQTGNLTLNTNQYTVTNTVLTAYASRMEMLEFEPDTILPPGDTVDFSGLLANGGDTIALQMRIVATNSGNEVYYSGKGGGFDLPWYSDNSFHSADFNMKGDPFTFKFKRIPDGTDDDDNVLFAVQENFIYSIDSTDLSDPNVINVMSYNIQITPIVSFDFFERTTYFPALISPYQDVVIIEEIFEDLTRINNLTPGMVAVGFPYYTTVLNDTALSNITSPGNGGVVIYSRWPIETEAEIKYANCSDQGAGDCLSSKGVKYARVNKLGKRYHIFGTHMEAGGSAADVQYRIEQYGEIANFMDTLGIPADEAVIFGGDFNTGPKDGFEYDSLRSKTNPIIPLHTGYFESTFSYADTGKIIDHVWGQADHLHPIASYNKVITFRSIDSVMWDIFDFSDHRTVLGRFVYPDMQPDSFGDTSLCATASLTLNVSANDSLSYSWTLNGTTIPGATSGSYTITDPGLSTAGVYVCEVTNSIVYGYQSDVLTQMFFPNGPVTLVQDLTYTLGDIGFEDPCMSGLPEGHKKARITVVPTPNNGRFEVHFESAQGDEVFELYSGDGRLILKKAYIKTLTTFDIADFPAGMYILRTVASRSNHTTKILVY